MNVSRYTENESLSLFVAWSKEPIPKWFFGCLFFDEGDFFLPQAFDWYWRAAAGRGEA